MTRTLLTLTILLSLWTTLSMPYVIKGYKTEWREVQELYRKQNSVQIAGVIFDRVSMPPLPEIK